MAAETQARQCSRPDCLVSQNGICVEGNTPPESCPFFGKNAPSSDDDYDDQDDAVQSGQNSVASPRITLATGDALTVAEVDQFLRKKPVKFVSIIGEHDSGKTTLICSFYEKFLKENFAGYLFAGSRTLVGFEKKTHYSRVDSGRVNPDTQRTSLADGLRFMHIALADINDTQRRIDLMISDRAGEEYEKARNQSSFVTKLIEVKKAHFVVLLLDGDRFASATTRHVATKSVRQTLRALLDGGALSINSRVQVVTTKIDLILAHPKKQDLEQQLANFKTGLEKDFQHRLARLTFLDVAARDPTNLLPIAYGVENLLGSWCAPDQLQIIHTLAPIVPGQLKTEFDRLLVRTPMEGL